MNYCFPFGQPLVPVHGTRILLQELVQVPTGQIPVQKHLMVIYS